MHNTFLFSPVEMYVELASPLVDYKWALLFRLPLNCLSHMKNSKVQAPVYDTCENVTFQQGFPKQLLAYSVSYLQTMVSVYPCGLFWTFDDSTWISIEETSVQCHHSSWQPLESKGLRWESLYSVHRLRHSNDFPSTSFTYVCV
jgi:hypothetical protein